MSFKQMPFHEFMPVVHKMPHDPATFDFKQAWISRGDEFQSYYKHFRAKRGLRYFKCSFDNYEIESESQQKAVDALREYVANGDRNLKYGKNIILFGPKGSGKDHLLVATCRELYRQCGGRIFWEQGVDLLRTTYGGDRFDSEIFGDTSLKMVADVLYVSDLVPPTGALSERQQAELFRIVDYRYSNLKPIFLTLNVATAQEAEGRLGAQSVDRLRDNALVVHCNWASKRSNKREFVVSDEDMQAWNQIAGFSKSYPQSIYRSHNDRDFLERIIPEVTQPVEPKP